MNIFSYVKVNLKKHTNTLVLFPSISLELLMLSQSAMKATSFNEQHKHSRSIVLKLTVTFELPVKKCNKYIYIYKKQKQTLCSL